MSLLSLSSVSFRYSSTVELFCDLTLSIDPSDRLAIVGANGAGKSTLLAMLAGEFEPSSGAIVRRRGLTFARVEQRIQSEDGVRLFDYVFEARPAVARLRRQMASAPDEIAYAEVVNDYQAAGGYSAEAGIERILIGLGFEARELNIPVERLSGGQKTRAALARALHAEADLLLLDEPTNHLDVAAREWLESCLRTREGACVIVSHDRTLLRQVANRVLQIERGEVKLFEGGYDDYRGRRSLLERQAWSDYNGQQRRAAAAEQAAEKRAKLAIKVATPPAGIKSSQDFYNRKAAKVARTARILTERVEREVEAKKPWMEQPIPELTFAEVKRSGDLTLRAERLAKSFGHRTLFADLSFHVARGERVAITGPNGCGKSTLMRILAGELDADEGKMHVGANVKVGYFAQDADHLDPDSSALEACGQGTLARTLLGCLKLRPDRVNDPLRLLSSGERGKVALASLLVSGANLLLLDEPTNHLEIEAQEALEQALQQFPGTLVIVSHDRAFLEGLGKKLTRMDLSSI